MRLNTYQKQAIVRAIMQDVPEVDTDMASKVIQAALVKAMSPVARKLYRESPKALRRDFTGYDVIGRGTYPFVVGDADLEEVLKPWKAQAEARNDARRKLKGVVNGCTTLKQLQTALPEFVKYMPTEEKPTANLPALANLSADFVKLGWKGNVNA